MQTSAGYLIECLIHSEDLKRAETFAQMTLDSLKDPGNGVDQNSEAVAIGYYLLGKVINNQKGDYVKAEILARESYRIRLHVYGSDHNYYVGASADLLATVLKSQDNLGDETRELYQYSLACAIQGEGPDGINVVNAHSNLGRTYYKLAEKEVSSAARRHLFTVSKQHYQEAVRILSKNGGPYNSNTATFATYLNNIRLYLERDT